MNASLSVLEEISLLKFWLILTECEPASGFKSVSHDYCMTGTVSFSLEFWSETETETDAVATLQFFINRVNSFNAEFLEKSELSTVSDSLAIEMTVKMRDSKLCWNGLFSSQESDTGSESLCDCTWAKTEEERIFSARARRFKKLRHALISSSSANVTDVQLSSFILLLMFTRSA